MRISVRRTALLIGLISCAAYMTSLALPVFLFPGTLSVSGMVVLTAGWLGVLSLQIGWIANPLYAYALWAFIRGIEPSARVASTFAFGIALTSFGAHQWWFNEGAGTDITGRGPGFYLWLVALFLLMSATWLARAGAQKPDIGDWWRAGRRGQPYQIQTAEEWKTVMDMIEEGRLSIENVWRTRDEALKCRRSWRERPRNE